MKIAVIGIGGVGGIVTSALKAVEDELILVCRGETAKAIKENGLIVRSDMLGDRVVKPFLVSNDPKEIGIVDAAIICCKTYSLKNVIEMYKDIIGKETLVVPLQNGVTAAGEAEKQLDGRGYVADGYIYCFSNIEKPGVIVNSGDLLKIGIGFSEIKSALWEKYIMMCGCSCAFIYYDCATGEIQKDPEKLEFLRGIYSDLKRIADHAGVKVNEKIVDNYMDIFMKNPPESISSLYRDIRNKKADTEYDAIIGGGIRLAQKYGADVPYMMKVYKK